VRQLTCVGLALLLVLVVSAQARAQVSWFDPRGLKTMTEGPPTQVMVLGTTHLAQLEKPLAGGALSLLLDRLAGFKPTIITVEAISGEGCDVLTRYKAIYPEVADQYCKPTADAEKATGLTVPAAVAEAAAELHAWPAAPTAAQRRHLAAVFLAAGDRPSAAVQWLRLPAAEHKTGDGVDAALLETLTALETHRNENFALAAALAARLGLERLYSADDHSADGITAPLGADFDKAIREVWSAPHSATRTALDAMRGAMRTPADVLAFYRRLNTREGLEDAIRRDFAANLAHTSPEHFGRQYVAWWETRNLRMAANIRAAFGNEPGARVLVVVGSSHKPYLDAYLDMMHEVRLVDPASVLQ
jgi:hypothetical protein